MIICVDTIMAHNLKTRSNATSVAHSITTSSNATPKHTTMPLSHYRSILKYWTSQILNRYFLSSVWLRISYFSQLPFMQYVVLCVFRLPILWWWLWESGVFYLITIIKSEVWPICHCLGLGHETMVRAVCLSIFLLNQHWFRNVVTSNSPVRSQAIN